MCFFGAWKYFGLGNLVFFLYSSLEAIKVQCSLTWASKFVHPRNFVTMHCHITHIHYRCVHTTKPGWCELKANWIYPGWTQLAHVCTRSGLIRVQWTWTVWATSRQLKRMTTRVPVARLSAYSALQHSKNVLDARARSAPFLTQLQPTLNPHTYVGWLNPGSTRFRKKWVECGLAISEFNPGWTRVRALVQTCLMSPYSIFWQFCHIARIIVLLSCNVKIMHFDS